jgi:hypothetical protein
VSVRVGVDGVVGAVEVDVLDDELPPQPAMSVTAVAPAAAEKKERREIPFCFECIGPGFTGKTPIEESRRFLLPPPSCIKGTEVTQIWIREQYFCYLVNKTRHCL